MKIAKFNEVFSTINLNRTPFTKLIQREKIYHLLHQKEKHKKDN